MNELEGGPALKLCLERDRYAQMLGIEVLDVELGRVKTRLLIREDHLNGLDAVHGGCIFSLADYTFAIACNTRDKVAVAINASISFVKAATSGYLHAQAEETSLSSRLGTYHVTITDDDGDVVALFEGLAYRKGR
jgi:acyl-CoA thioesterase